MRYVLTEEKSFIPKIRPTKQEPNITLQFLLADDLKRKYKIVFMVLGIEEKPEKRKLRKAILDNISSFDRKYMILNNFNTRKAVFYLNERKWFNDALRGVRPKTELSTFSRSYKLKIKIPDMIKDDILMDNFFEFIKRHFKEWIDKKDRKILKDFRLKTRRKISSMFDYEYDYQWNTITVRLKTIYRVGLIFGIRKTLFGRNRNFNFNKSVSQNLNSFNRRRWRKYVGRKFI